MSLETQLGLEAPDGDLWVLAHDRWHTWKKTDPVLDRFDDLTDVRAWSQRTDIAEVNVVHLALAELGAEDGGNDPAATGALLWLLMPGASRMAQALMPLSDRIDQLVAAQLWIAARTVSWRAGIRVAGTVLRNTRREVMADLGLSSASRRRDVPVDDMERSALLLAASSSRTDPRSQLGQPWEAGVVSSTDGACDLLFDLLEVAAEQGLVGLEDCRILLELAEVAESPRTSRGHAGLLSREAANTVAAGRGLSRATVCRRARGALTVLQDTYANQVRSA